jgi:hypothetical protein
LQPAFRVRDAVAVRRVIEILLLTSVLLVTRVAFRSHYLYDIDSVNFALALRRFDPSVHQPHPPGYFLYVWLGRAASLVFHDANTAFVFISIMASAGALIMICALANNWFGRGPAFFAGLIFVFSPLVWFHGTVALTYAAEMFFSAFTGYLCWRVYCEGKLAVAAAATAGLAAGFRPSFLLFLTPLLLFSLLFSPALGRRRRLLAATGALSLTVCVWFFPMVSQSGGFEAYFSALLSLWRTVPGRQTLLNSTVANSTARLFSIGAIYVLCFGVAALLSFRRVQESRLDRPMRTFILVWILPGLLFFTLVFLKFVNSGYLLVIAPPAFAWLGLKAANWYRQLPMTQPRKAVLVGICAAANSLMFLFAPVYSSWSSVHRFEAELENVVRTIPTIALPADTMIVAFDSHFLGYRHAGYYLPGWFTVQYPEVRLAPGIRVFAMEGADTHLAETLPLDRFRNFLLFPLPTGDTEYADYMIRIRSLLPRDSIRTIGAGGREYTFGAVSDLPLLFPAASKPAAEKGR